MFARIVRASILHHRGQLTMALAAVLVPAALVMGVANFVLDARAKMRHELRQRGPNLIVIFRSPPVDARVAQVFAPRYERMATLPNGLEVRVIGVDAEPMRRMYPGWRVEGRWLADDCMVGTRLAERLRVRPGDRLLGRTIEGVVETGQDEDDVVFVPRDPTMPIERVDLSINASVEEIEELARQWEAHTPGLEARVQRQIAASEGAILDKLTLAFGLVALLVGAVAALSMAVALAASVARRRREFAILRALGAADESIVRLLVAEAAVLLSVGVALGGGLGVAISEWLGRSVFGQGVAVRPGALVATALACVVITAAAAVLPLSRALAVEPAAVLKEE